MAEPERSGAAEPGRIRRAPVVAGVVGLLVVGGLADRAAAGGRAPGRVGQPVGVAAPAAALSSSWFCGGATGTGGEAPGSLELTNAGAAAETATITLVPDVGPRTTEDAAVGPHSSVEVAEHVGSRAHWVGAEVDFDGGRAAVEQVVRGPQGASGTPCATSGSSTWWFAGGATSINASDVLTLFNPYDSDAIVDLSFTTDQGMEMPGDFQGLDVPAGSTLAVDLGTHLRRRTQIATTVHARTGRVVAFSTADTTPPARGEALLGGPVDPSNPTSADPASPAAGIAVTLGAPALATTLVWPDGGSGGGLDERYVIYNPSATTARLTLSVALDQGQAEPFVLQVGPGQVSTVDADAEARIPPGIGHSATLQSTNAVGVTAVRLLSGVGPAAHLGSGALPGEALAARSWVVPVADGPGTGSGSGAGAAAADLAVVPTGAVPLDLTVEAVRPGGDTPIPGLEHLTLAPGQRRVLAVPAGTGAGASVLVEASGPVYVESDIYGDGAAKGAGAGRGIWLAPGVPLG